MIRRPIIFAIVVSAITVTTPLAVAGSLVPIDLNPEEVVCFHADASAHGFGSDTDSDSGVSAAHAFAELWDDPEWDWAEADITATDGDSGVTLWSRVQSEGPAGSMLDASTSLVSCDVEIGTAPDLPAGTAATLIVDAEAEVVGPSGALYDASYWEFTVSRGAAVLVNTASEGEFGVAAYAGETLSLEFTEVGDTSSSLHDVFGLEITVSMHIGGSADLNCDSLVNNGDIDPFVLAITQPGQYAVDFPECDIMNGDINGDGWTNNGDIDAFVALLGA